jgi:hypothetical protein
MTAQAPSRTCRNSPRDIAGWTESVALCHEAVAGVGDHSQSMRALIRGSLAIYV